MNSMVTCKWHQKRLNVRGANNQRKLIVWVCYTPTFQKATKINMKLPTFNPSSTLWLQLYPAPV